jgi:predicted amidohydrolase
VQPDGKPSFGRSMIVDPWGLVLAQAPDADSVVTADLDLVRLRSVRERLPSLANRRPDAYGWPDAVPVP